MIQTGRLFGRALRAGSIVWAFALCVAACPGVFAPSVHAQSWPTRPVRLIVPITAGTLTDITARLIADRLRVTLGQQIIVDNRGGAGGIVGMSALARSAPDGYTNGSDYPHNGGDPVGCLARVDALRNGVRDKVRGLNAQRLFKI